MKGICKKLPQLNSLRTADVFRDVASLPKAEKTGCSRRLATEIPPGKLKWLIQAKLLLVSFFEVLRWMLSFVTVRNRGGFFSGCQLDTVYLQI